MICNKCGKVIEKDEGYLIDILNQNQKTNKIHRNCLDTYNPEIKEAAK